MYFIQETKKKNANYSQSPSTKKRPIILKEEKMDSDKKQIRKPAIAMNQLSMKVKNIEVLKKINLKIYHSQNVVIVTKDRADRKNLVNLILGIYNHINSEIEGFISVLGENPTKQHYVSNNEIL